MTSASRGNRLRLQLVLIGVCLAALVALAGTASPALGKAGELDPSFGSNGRVLRHGGGFVDMAKLPNSDIVVASQDALYAYRSDGRPDRRFGDNGTVDPLSPDGTQVTIEDIAVDGQGRIVVVGSARHLVTPAPSLGSTYAAIMRYLPNGRFDEGFGSGGIVFSDLALPPAAPPSVPSYAQPVSTAPEIRTVGAAVDSHEHIVLTGARAVTYVFSPKSAAYAPELEAFVARLRPGGSLDPSFGTNGTELLGGLGSTGRPVSDRQAGVYFAADPQSPPFSYGFPEGSRVVGHLDSSGAVDRAFGKDGWQALTNDSSESDLDITFDREGRLLIPGQGSGAGIERLEPNGSLDRRFGHDGMTTIAHPDGEVRISDLAVTRTGKILATGVLTTETKPPRNGPIWRILLARLSQRGRLDKRFSKQGAVVTRFGNESTVEGQAVIAEGSGRALVGGTSSTGFVLARYFLGG